MKLKPHDNQTTAHGSQDCVRVAPRIVDVCPAFPSNFWTNIARFNFTYAMDGGAWLETHPYLTSAGYVPYREWFSRAEIDRHMGPDWFMRQLRKQGWMTGCWINVE